MYPSENSIDAVITWVDGSDPAHRKKLNDYLISINHVPESASLTRFLETGEFEYCIASMLRFAPWIRKIFIVTDNQVPSFMQLVHDSPNRDRIVIVDHKLLFRGYEQYLPTFNSRSLASMLWRIPGLSDRYLYLNDDMIFIRPLSSNDFFVGSTIVEYGSWRMIHNRRPDVVIRKMFNISSGRHSGNCKVRPGNRAGQSKGAGMAGFRYKYLLLPHAPHPQLRSLQAKFYEAHPGILEKNISHALRSAQQYVPEALVFHLALKSSGAEVRHSLVSMLLQMDKISVPWLRMRLAMADRYNKIAFACVQSLDMASPQKREMLMHFLNRRVGAISENLHWEYRPEK